MSAYKIKALLTSLTQATDDAREKALFEIRDMKKDIFELEKFLAGRKKVTEIEADDIIRSAYDFAHYYRDMRLRASLIAGLEQDLAEAEAREYLEERDAKLLKKPAGWHWTSSQDERHLLHADDPIQAAEALRKLFASGKKRKRKTRRKKK